jgi:cyanophycinase
VTVFLVGGGPDTLTTRDLLDPFVEEMASHADRRGRRPRVAIAVFEHEGSADRFLPDYADALAVGSAEVVPVYVRRGVAVARSAFEDVDAVVVGGGPTPDYLAGLQAAADGIADVVTTGVPYLGFSAGAMIAARTALVGGHRLGDEQVCPEEWSEGLVPLTLRPGLGLVGFTVDVHTAEAGTLGRTVAVVESGQVAIAVGIDEDTCLAAERSDLQPEDLAVTGTGSAWLVRAANGGGSVVVNRRPAPGRRPGA